MTNELPKNGKYDNDMLKQRLVDALQITENHMHWQVRKRSSSF